MKSLAALCLALLATATPSASAERASITLKTGTVLEDARIVALGKDTATIVHRGGSATVPMADVDLELLARAQMELEETAAVRRQRAAAATKAAEARKAEADEQLKARVALAHAESAARSGQLRNPAKEIQSNENRAGRVAALKAAFPAKAQGNARVFIPKSGKNRRPHLVSSTISEMPDGRRYSSTTTTGSSGEGRVDTIQYSAPPEDTWSWYKSMFYTTTLQALPRTLQLVEQRMAEDTAKYQTASSSLQSSTAAQAQHTLYWIDRQLRPHVAAWRALLK